VHPCTVTYEEIDAGVRAALSRTLRIPADEIRTESDLESIGLDSMAMIHVNISLEEKYGVTVAAYDAPDAGLRTVADLVHFAAKQIGATPAAQEVHA
jgi:acyl carrier protein